MHADGPKHSNRKELLQVTPGTQNHSLQRDTIFATDILSVNDQISEPSTKNKGEKDYLDGLWYLCFD